MLKILNIISIENDVVVPKYPKHGLTYYLTPRVKRSIRIMKRFQKRRGLTPRYYQRSCQTKQKINKVETTADTLTGRGGLALIGRYIEKTGILEILENKFGHLRKSAKGLPADTLFKQIICFIFDGTSRHLTYFDELKKDKGYAAAIETKPSDMASSHTIKRFFNKFGLWCGQPFRSVLHQLFIWRLKIENPEEIELYIDTMVMDNDDALKRQGVQLTYKKKKGFQPLQIIWNGKIVDGIFRGGKKNGNSGDTVVNMVRGLVYLIRLKYRKDVTIILRCDSGFFDQKNFAAFNDLNIAFISSGKMYEGVKTAIKGVPESSWNEYDNGHQKWNFTEFGFRCDSWSRFYRAVYTRPFYEGKQMQLDFERPDNVILTNIGINAKALEFCSPNRKKHWQDCKTLINSYHRCGAGELAHRGFKDFGSEQLPFKKFQPDMALYYCMLISFFLFETFKEDVLEEVIPITSYAATVRRKAIDFAAKIVKTGRMVILKVHQSVADALKINLLWEKCQNPPPILS